MKQISSREITMPEQLALADLPKPRVVETALQRAVIDLAKLRGWLVFHAFDSRKSTGPGWPDLATAA